MRKTLFLGLMLVSLTACAPQTTITAFHWNAFVKMPDEARFRSLYADIKACKVAGCPQGAQINEEMIDDLADLVRSKNHQALRVALASKTLLGTRAGVVYLAASYGPIIEEDPRAFLQAVTSESNSDIANVLTTPQGQIANYNGEYYELAMRRTRLSHVDDPSLIGIRDQFVSALDNRRNALEPNVYRSPRPIP